MDRHPVAVLPGRRQGRDRIEVRARPLALQALELGRAARLVAWGFPRFCRHCACELRVGGPDGGGRCPATVDRAPMVRTVMSRSARVVMPNGSSPRGGRGMDRVSVTMAG